MGLIQILSNKVKGKSSMPSGTISTFLVVFAGESNSGGRALNADATTYEKTARTSVKKISEYTFLFENLQVGVNNTQDHSGLTDNSEHGWELGLSNNVESGTFIGKSQIHLVKTGQGGSTISQWNYGGTYFNKLTARYNAAKGILISESKTYKPIIWYTQGINDALAGTTTATWKAATIAHFAQLRTLIGSNTPILIPEIMAGAQGTAYNPTIVEICNEVSNCYLISCTGAGLKDSYHWNYTGMKLLADRFSAKTEELLSV